MRLATIMEQTSYLTTDLIFITSMPSDGIYMTTNHLVLSSYLLIKSHFKLMSIMNNNSYH
jgi:hypothetical protein